MIYDRSLCQRLFRSICPVSAPINASSLLRVVLGVYLSGETAVRMVHVEEMAAGHEVRQLRDAFCPVLPAPASSAPPEEALPASTLRWRTTAFYR